MEKTAIEKIRAIARWANDMNEWFNGRIKNVNDWIVLYDLAEKHNIEFIDEAEDYENGKAFMMEANATLGYKLYKA
jgi:hypothetical protein